MTTLRCGSRSRRAAHRSSPLRALHAHVAQDDVGVQLGDHAHRALGADGLADDLDAVAERRQHRLEPLDDHLVVVDQHQPHRGLCGGRHGTSIGPAFGLAAKLARSIPRMGEAARRVTWATLDAMTQIPDRAWRAGRFWWDSSRPERGRSSAAASGDLRPRRAHRRRVRWPSDWRSTRPSRRTGCPEWSAARYRKLLALRDERQRVAAELRARGDLHRVRRPAQGSRRRDLRDQVDDGRRDDARRRSGRREPAWSI